MVYYETNALCHYGLKGMKWGTRRWQYQDGRFNADGKARYFGQNSSHRPDSVRKLQGDPPKTNRSSGKNNRSGRSFDKERAKKIAKGVAIGTAVVGGTVLAVYGAKKINDLGGVSKIAQNAVAKHREVKLENLKATQEYKVERAKILGEGKQNLAKTVGEGRQKLAKTRLENRAELAKVKEEGRANLQRTVEDVKKNSLMKSIDPDGDFGNSVIEKEMRLGMQPKEIKKKLATLDSQEKALLRDGVVNLKDLKGRRDMSANEWVSSKETSYDKWLNELSKGNYSAKKPISDAKSAVPSKVNVNVNINRKGSTNVQNLASNANKNVKNVIEKVNNTKLPKITPDHLKAGSELLSEFNKSVQTANQIKREQKAREAEVVKEYRKEHPGTKLSDKQIMKNYGS